MDTETIADLIGLHPVLPWILVIAAATRWLVTAGSLAYERIITSRAERDRSRRDADLAEARYRDERISGRVRDAVGVDHWESEKRSRR